METFVRAAAIHPDLSPKPVVAVTISALVGWFADSAVPSLASSSAQLNTDWLNGLNGLV